MADLKMKSGFGCPGTGLHSHFPKRATLSPRFQFVSVSNGIELTQEISLYVLS